MSLTTGGIGLEFHFVNADTNFYEFAYINEDLSGLNLYATKTKTGLVPR